MANLPNSVMIQEVGPRDGLQIESRCLNIDQKVAMIRALVDAGLREIEIGSFVNPKAVPQMAGTAEVLDRLPDKQGVNYRALWLNTKGLEQAVAARRIAMDGKLTLTASETFIKRNTNRSIDETIADMPQWIALYRKAGVEPRALGLMAAFGCNFEGEVPSEKVIGLIARVKAVMNEHDCDLQHVRLADTMGWANPIQTAKLVDMVWSRWPGMGIRLHLHDTRGLAIANAFAAMQLGVREFDAAVGGLGGCPFAGLKGAAGNVATEDLAFMCEEVGIETGIDVEALAESARFVEGLVGHPLVSKVMQAGTLKQYRR
jgi:hydroxymethylglutaryl-CoA lyase